MTSSRKLNHVMEEHDISTQESEDLDTSSASGDQDMNYSSAAAFVPRPVFHHAEKAEMPGMMTSQLYRHAPPMFPPLPLIVRRPVASVEFSTVGPRV